MPWLILCTSFHHPSSIFVSGNLVWFHMRDSFSHRKYVSYSAQNVIAIFSVIVTCDIVYSNHTL